MPNAIKKWIFGQFLAVIMYDFLLLLSELSFFVKQIDNGESLRCLLNSIQLRGNC